MQYTQKNINSWDLKSAIIIKDIVCSRSEKIIASAQLVKLLKPNGEYKSASASVEDIESGKRVLEITIVRYVAQAIIKELTGLTLKGIGAVFSNRDHATIIHALDEVEDLKNQLFSFNKTYNEILEECRIPIDRARVIRESLAEQEEATKTPPPPNSNPVDKELGYLAVNQRQMLDYSKNSTPVKRIA